MRQVIERQFQGQRLLFGDSDNTPDKVVADARAEFEKLHELPINDPDEQEGYYRRHVEASKPLQSLKRAMDQWCAVWFWPTDEASLRHAPTPHKLYAGEELCADTTIAIAGQVRFFHWELEFPDVFTSTRRGFDALIGNPPWDVMEPNSQEFFTDFHKRGMLVAEGARQFGGNNCPMRSRLNHNL
jgi:hypothetical protein